MHHDGGSAYGEDGGDLGGADECGMRASAKACMTRSISLLLAACLAIPMAAPAQMESIEIAKVFSVRHLAGVAVDSTGATVADVKVEICKVDWTGCFASATTGGDGRFSFSSVPHESVHHMKVSARGFDQLRMRVQQRFFARKELVVKLHIAA